MNQAKSEPWDKACPPLLFLISLTVYALTAGKHVTYADSGEFILTGKYLGLPHPPGYPLYTLIAHMFSYLPIGTLAYRIHMVNAVLGAALNVLVFKTLRRFQVSIILSVITALIFAFSGAKWYQSIIAEVYTLHAVFLVILMNLAWDLRDSFTPKKALWFIFVYALSLSNHWPLMGISTPAFLWVLRRQIWPMLKLWKVAIPLALLGLAPYLYLYFRSQADPLYSFLPPMRGLLDLVRYFLRSYYANLTAQQLFNYQVPFQFLWHSLKLIIIDYGPLFFAAMAFGVFSLARRRQSDLLNFLVFNFLTSTFFLYFLLRVEFAGYFIDAHYEFLLVPTVAAGLLVGFGLQEFNRQVPLKVVIFLSLLAFGFEFYTNLPRNNFKHDTFVNDYATYLVEAMPKESHVVLNDDTDMFVVAYVADQQFPEKKLRFYSKSGIVFGNRMVDPFLPVYQQGPRFEKFLKDRKSVLFIGEPPFIVDDKPAFQIHDHGAFLQVVPSDGSVSKLDTDLVKDHADRIVRARLADHTHDFYWPYLQGTMMENFCRYFLVHGPSDQPIFTEQLNCSIIKSFNLFSTQHYKEAYTLLTSKLPKLEGRLMSVEVGKTYELWFNSLLHMLDAAKDMTAEQKAALFQANLPYVYDAFKFDKRCDSPTLKAVQFVQETFQTPIDMDRIRAEMPNCK